jgi:hypothetical protein
MESGSEQRSQMLREYGFITRLEWPTVIILKQEISWKEPKEMMLFSSRDISRVNALTSAANDINILRQCALLLSKCS